MQGTLAIVGAGRVGRALGRSLRRLGWRIGEVVTLNPATCRRAVRFIGAGIPSATMSRRLLTSTVILITTPDGAIAQAAAELARIGAEELRGKVILHTSGALDSSVLSAVREHGASAASMHPLQTFSGVGVPALEGKVFAIEGDPLAVRTARYIARSLGGAPTYITAGKKPLYHAAGTLAAGHTLVVAEAAVRLLMSLGMKRKEALRALLPMTRQVLDNYQHLGPHAAWTGPLSRGDYAVVAAHVRALQQYSLEYKDAYESLNRLAERILPPLAQNSFGAPLHRDALEPALGIGETLQRRKTKAKATGGKE